MTALHLKRRHLLLATLAMISSGRATSAEPRRFLVAFANLNEEPGARIDGLGFTGAEIRRSFELASRALPLDMIYYDNGGDADKALGNARDAVSRKVDLLIEYNSDAGANAKIGRELGAAGVPVLAVNYPVPGAPLYSADHREAGRIAGQALGKFARENWSDQTVVAAILGDVSDPSPALTERIQGVTEGVKQELPELSPARLDSAGHPVRAGGVLAKFLAAQTNRKVLVATLDDATALAAKSAVEAAGRISDCVIVSQGADRSVHGGASEKKEIDPANRGSIVLGSVAYYFDRYGYEILPIALRMLRGEQVPARTSTKHVLISAKNVFVEYPPYDMN
ncbi:sugar ABC transporter substrate-binding protein [Bradyrhizobium sp.]|uniref:sugar ABC transporter substrate-binding protein n=1 Tax=Bradyrhizobium sp. TaxID=376 RepID=UPI003C725EDC